MSDDTRETIPITSPLAVLTTQTTQEHIMTTHSPTDLKPGDFVRHPTRLLNGLVRRSRVNRDEVVIMRLEENIDSLSDYDLTGWERVETVRPGHVQVRVNDLDNAHTIASWAEWAGCDTVEEACKRIGQAFVAQQVGQAQPAESTPPADEPPMSTTVTLPCPGCGEAVTDTATVGIEDEGGYYLTFANSETHACPPAQPDEPTEFGARIVVTRPDGIREKWLRQIDGWWVNEVGGQAMWKYLLGRGAVTLGWDE